VNYSIVAIAAVSMVVSAAPAMCTTVIVNGGFENGLNGWSTSGRVEALLGSIYADGISTAATQAQRDNTYAFFGGANETSINTLSQSFATIAGRTYSFSFEAVDVGGGAQDVSFDFGGQTGSTDLTPANNFSLARTFTGSFVASSATSTVTFTNSSFADNTDVALDNVSVSLTPVPEIATWAMLIAGFGVIGVAQRRRRSITFAA
jgi:hypothetical protein